MVSATICACGGSSTAADVEEEAVFGFEGKSVSFGKFSEATESVVTEQGRLSDVRAVEKKLSLLSFAGFGVVGISPVVCSGKRQTR